MQVNLINNFKIELLSIILITYGREIDLVECISSILKQDYENFEIILIDNNENKKVSEYISEYLSKIDDKRINYFKASTNLGVTRGRELGISKANGDILIFIDDDAFFEKIDACQMVLREFSQNSNIGILSFKIINYYSKKIEPAEFPHRNKKLNPGQQFETTYFTGGACAIRRDVFENVGGYADDFFYGMEELDLSFRVIDTGYQIFYFPAVVVWHKQSPHGRLDKKRTWQNYLENRIKLSIRNLPWRYVLISGVIWAGKSLYETHDFRILLRVGTHIWTDRRSLFLSRKVIEPKTIQNLKKMNGRLYF